MTTIPTEPAAKADWSAWGSAIHQTAVDFQAGTQWAVRRRPTVLSGLTAGADNAAVINSALAAAKPYDVVKLPAGTWTHSGTLRIPASVTGVTLDGYGATLVGTTPATAGLIVQGNSCTLQGVTHRVDWGTATPTRGNGNNNDDCPIAAFDCSDVTLTDCVSIGSRDAAVFLYNVNGATIRNVSGRDSMADGLHFSGGTRNVTAHGVRMVNPGDDGCATVSYTNDAKACDNIRVHDIHITNSQARGVSIVGGSNINYSDFSVRRCRGSGVYVAHEQGDFNTSPVSACTISDGEVIDGNWDTSLDTGIIGVFNLVPNTTMTDVRIMGVWCLDQRKYQPYGKVGSTSGNGGRYSGLLLQDITFAGGSAAGNLIVDGTADGTVTVGNYTYVRRTGTGVTSLDEGFSVSGTTSVSAATTTTAAPGVIVRRVRLGGRWAAA